jgi:phosphohistidine phosphatase SixA
MVSEAISRQLFSKFVRAEETSEQIQAKNRRKKLAINLE